MDTEFDLLLQSIILMFRAANGFEKLRARLGSGSIKACLD